MITFPLSLLSNRKSMAMKKKQILKVFIVFSFLLSSLTSCNSNFTQNKTSKPDAIGGTSEVLIVLQNVEQWNGPIGKVIGKYFQAPIYGLPQNEPRFKLLHIGKSTFDGVFKTECEIFFVNIDPKIKKPKIEIAENVWAYPQIVIYLTAPSEESFVDIFKNHHEDFISRYIKYERKRIQDQFKSVLDLKVVQKIEHKFGFTLDVPNGYYVAKTKPGFMWIRYEASKFSQGIMIISLPYIDTAQFSRDNILQRIQKFQQNYIPGPTKGSYMSLDRKYMVPRATTITNFPTKYAVKVDGLWRVENDFMGGPFVSYTFLDPKNNQVVTLFGYVYYPNHKKRDKLLQVESILYSVNVSPQPNKKVKSATKNPK